MRVAAEACANVELRIALGAAAGEEDDLAAIEAALAADASESGGSPKNQA